MENFKSHLFSPEQLKIVASCINRYGSGQHPVAHVENVKYAKTAYAVKCMNRAKKAGKLSPEGLALIDSVLEVLEPAKV